MGCLRVAENKEPSLFEGSLKIGFKSAHLGNVTTTVSDKKIVENISGVGLRFSALVTSATEYYPFGMAMPGRTYESPSYRYGFQGQERDQELMNGGYAFKHRIHDPRTGRFLSLDPLIQNYPYNSPYAFSENRVLDGFEMEGAQRVSSWQDLAGTMGTYGFGHDNTKNTNSTYNKAFVKMKAEQLHNTMERQIVETAKAVQDSPMLTLFVIMLAAPVAIEAGSSVALSEMVSFIAADGSQAAFARMSLDALGQTIANGGDPTQIDVANVLLSGVSIRGLSPGGNTLVKDALKSFIDIKDGQINIKAGEQDFQDGVLEFTLRVSINTVIPVKGDTPLQKLVVDVTKKKTRQLATQVINDESVINEEVENTGTQDISVEYNPVYITPQLLPQPEPVISDQTYNQIPEQIKAIENTNISE